MKRNHILVALALAAILVGGSCNTKSPTAPPPSPTPTSYSLGLVASASSSVVGDAIVLTATVTTSGGQKAPDGTGVTFKLVGCTSTGATDPSLDNGGCSEVRTTSAGVAAASVLSKSNANTFQVQAIVGSAQSSVIVSFYNPVNPLSLAIYGIVPNQGSYLGGQTVTIQGRGIQAPATVDFIVSGTTRHAAVVSVAADGSSVVVTTPNTQFISGVASVPSDVTVTSAAGTSNATSTTLSSGFTFVFPQSPTGVQIYSIVPAVGLVTGGDTVTIYGANFVPPVTVMLGTENAQVATVSADQSTVTIVTPKHSGTVPLTGLAVDVIVTNGAGKSVTRSGGFTWLPVSTSLGAPIIYQVSPNLGSPRGGDTVTILGANLCGTVSSATGQCNSSPSVSFTFTTAPYSDTRAAQVVSVSPDGKTLIILTPQVSPNPVLTDVNANITIANLSCASQNNCPTFTNVFTFKSESAPPILYYLQPSVGSCLGGDTVTIFGRYLIAPLKVTFSAAAGNDAQFISASSDGTSAQIVTPAASSCAGNQVSNVTVITQYGTGRDSSPVTITGAFTFNGQTYQPQIYSLSPNAGPLAGGTQVTIEGTGFMYPVQVLFGTIQAQVVSSNFNEIICVAPSITPSAPSTPTTVQVQVINTKGSLPNTSNTLPFYYGQAMFISSNGPGVGPDTGGTTVTIFGQGFVAPVAVTLAGIPALPLTVSGTEIVCTSGAVLQRQCTPITGSVMVTDINSNTSATGGAWAYSPATPLITGLTVSGSGASGNTIPHAGTSCYSGTYTLTIYGTNFEPGNMHVTFGTVNIEVPVPAGSTTPTSITVTIPNLSGVTMKTASCITATDQTGSEALPTPIDITVTNISNKCSDTLTGGLIIQPCTNAGSPDLCSVPPTPPPAPTVTITPTTQTVSASGTLPAQVSFIVTVTPAQTATVNLTYAGNYTFCTDNTCTTFAANGNTVTTNSSGVGSLTLWVPTGVVNGDSAQVVGSFSSASSAPAVVNIGP